MNHLRNDKGEWVIAVGAPGSRARVRCEYPALIESLTKAIYQHDLSIYAAKRRITKAGIRSMLEVESLLIEAGYNSEEAEREARL